MSASTQPAEATPSNTATWVIVAVALVVAGFLGGFFLGHHSASNHLGNASRHGIFGRPGSGGFGHSGGNGGNGGGPGFGNGSNGGGFGGPSFGNIAVGTVQRVHGSTIYLRTREGGSLKVETDHSTQLRLANGGGVDSLKPGATIFVRGTPAGSGALKATGILEPTLPQAAPST